MDILRSAATLSSQEKHFSEALGEKELLGQELVKEASATAEGDT